MKSLSALAGLALLVGASSAKKCRDISVPVTISATNIAFNFAPPADNIEAITSFSTSRSLPAPLASPLPGA